MKKWKNKRWLKEKATWQEYRSSWWGRRLEAGLSLLAVCDWRSRLKASSASSSRCCCCCCTCTCCWRCCICCSACWCHLSCSASTTARHSSNLALKCSNKSIIKCRLIAMRLRLLTLPCRRIFCWPVRCAADSSTRTAAPDQPALELATLVMRQFMQMSTWCSDVTSS